MCVYDNDESCENEESEDDSPNEKKKKDKGGTCYWYMLTLRIIADFKAKEEKNIK